MPTSGGALTWTYDFCETTGLCVGGFQPASSLIQGTDGNLYGTTLYGGGGGGVNGNGVLFQITTGGSYTQLYALCMQPECADGAIPSGSLMQATTGLFYGMTQGGGANGVGTIFSLSMGLGPFVEPQTTSGAVGATVNILGSGLTNASSVTFNGVSAAFTVVSGSEITATVPTGATTGPIQVVKPHGTLVSNVPFQVTP
jgi:uncharacterized repeat protein (TIGR03803 family)